MDPHHSSFETRPLALLLPGSIEQLTGDHLYARRLVAGLRARGIAVAVHELAGAFPEGDDAARRAAASALAALPDGTVAVIDGLALAAVRDGFDEAAARLALLALVHHPLPEEGGLGAEIAAALGTLERRLLPRVRGVICPSAATAAAVAAYGVARVELVPPGTMKPAQPVARASHAAPVRLLSVATITPRKGHDVLVAALAWIAELPWRLEIVGSLDRDPATVAAVRAAVARHGLDGRIALLGERPPEGLGEAYAAADLFVLASHHEGYGMAFAEALAAGLPVVATTGGAIPELVPSTAGLLVPPGDVPALARALARLINDRGLRARLGAGAAAASALLPSWDDAVERWLAAAARILA